MLDDLPEVANRRGGVASAVKLPVGRQAAGLEVMDVVFEKRLCYHSRQHDGRKPRTRSLFGAMSQGSGSGLKRPNRTF